jgi:hypothetical protein
VPEIRSQLPSKPDPDCIISEIDASNACPSKRRELWTSKPRSVPGIMHASMRKTTLRCLQFAPAIRNSETGRNCVCALENPSQPSTVSAQPIGQPLSSPKEEAFQEPRSNRKSPGLVSVTGQPLIPPSSPAVRIPEYRTP